MRKKGFTLIELLAVIVILAIIALIATPIILGIINDARKESQERSIELYASAVRNAVAAYQLTGTSAPKSFSDLDVQYDGNVECSVKELYEDGSFYLEGCKVNGGEKEYSYGTQQGTTIEVGKLNSVCDPVNIATQGLYTMGDEYLCEVKDGVKYTFYILNTPETGATSVNLIMDSNIRADGTPVKDTTDIALVEYKKYGSNEIGPVTAINYLNNATSTWKNISNLNETYDDASGYFEDFQLTGKARLPKLSEIGETGCGVDISYIAGSCPLWMVNYLYDPYGEEYEGRTQIVGVGGYWTMDVSLDDSAWYVWGVGSGCDGVLCNGSGDIGVRPVINLSI